MTPQARHPVWPLSTASSLWPRTWHQCPKKPDARHVDKASGLVFSYVFRKGFWAGSFQVPMARRSAGHQVNTPKWAPHDPSSATHLLAPKCFSSPRVYAAQQQDFSAPAKARFLSPAAGRVNYHATRIPSEFESTKIRITKSKSKRKKSSPISWNLLGKKHHYECMDSKSFRVSEAHLWVGSASSHFHGN